MRDFTAQRKGLDTDVVLGTGREAWRLSVICGTRGRPCPSAAVTLELGFDPETPPSAFHFSLRHELEGYETDGSPSIVTGANGCMEDDFRLEAPKTRCTLEAHDGWDSDDLARRRGHPNPDESADEDRPRIFVVRIENAGAPIKVHVRFFAIWNDGF